MGTEPADGFELFERLRLAAGHVPEVNELIGKFDRWIEDGSGRPLESYLQLPTTPARRTLYQRDAYLVNAAQFVRAAGPWQGCQLLAGEWHTFVTRGGWQHCRGGAELYAGITSAFSVNLFHATRLNDGRYLSSDRLYRIERVRCAFAKTHQSESLTIELRPTTREQSCPS